MVSVAVPDGCMPGDSFTVNFEGQDFVLIVPDGVHFGELIEVELPVNGGVGDVTIMVVIPDGCYEGMEFTVDFDGRQFNIGVPKGCGAGDEIEVAVPPDEELSLQESGFEREQQRQRRHPCPTMLPGRRVQLHGLVAKGILNGRKGTVRGHDAKGDVLVAIDGMAPDVPIKADCMLELPSDDEVEEDGADEPPEAPPAGVHYVGDRVHVERSNGGISLATIIEYDEVMETYTLELGSGLLKYGVEESYITPYETSDAWAGPSRRIDGRWEGFWVGRRVRIPNMLPNADEDDKNGEIVGYDEATNFYHVELDSGRRRTTLLFKDLKVVYCLRDDEVYS